MAARNGTTVPGLEDAMMIDIGGKLINPAHIVTADVDTRYYMNGSASWLVVKLDDGSEIRREHGWGFDVWAALATIRGATNS